MPAIDAPVAIHAAALKRRRSKAKVTRDLSSIFKGPVENLICQNCGEIVANGADLAQGPDCSARLVVLRLQSLLTFGLDFADHFERDDKPTAQAVQFRPQERRNCSAVACLRRFQVSFP